MAILTQNIKLLKSAVMADTTDGGGQMTGTEVIDGQSNNLFPDTSAMDRAFGRVNMRKVFGVAHTADTDTLLGAHAIMTDAPDDPLVHCTLLKTSGWSDERNAAREAIEKYLVKGPKMPSVFIYETHYAGSLNLRLFTFTGAPAPVGGDAVVLRNPVSQGSAEQYVRILTVKATSLTVTADNADVPMTVYDCTLGQAIAFDVYGATSNSKTIVESNFAVLYTTTVAPGAKFYGVKPLGVPAVIGDLNATTSSGIYTNLVPAATIETPITDQYPLLNRAAVAVTALASVNLGSTSSVSLGPNSVVYFPTAIEPNSLSIVHASNTFTDTGGILYLGVTAVGTVDYVAGTATFSSSAGNYGSSTLTPTYKPATVSGASSNSAELVVTIANQGLAYTDIFNPKPALGSFTLSFMAQGRWYDLTDNLNGKLVGADTGYGVGTLNYTTGSMAVTLGAIPDVGSSLIASWGDQDSATAITGTLPARAALKVALSPRTKAQGATATWSRGGTNYSAVTDASGVFSGGATGSLRYGELVLMPAVFPDGNVTFTTELVATAQTAFTGSGGSYTLTGTLPIVPGTFSASVIATLPSNVLFQEAVQTWGIRDSNGVLYANGIAAGTIDYATGAVTVSGSVLQNMWYLSDSPAVGGGFINGSGTVFYTGRGNLSVSLGSPITNVNYSAGATENVVTVVTPSTWQLDIDASKSELVTHGLMFNLGNATYSSKGAALGAGWNAATGFYLNAAAGSTSSTGNITITALPSNGVNTVTWINAASNASARRVNGGIFRTEVAPLKTGVFQLQAGLVNGSGNDAGVLSGGGFTGTVDYTRGIARWAGPTIDPSILTYNAVYLQYLPLEASLLGLETARLPLDGKVPIYRTGDLVVVHNTLTTALPNPLTKDLAYDLGRERIASVRVKDVFGVVVPDTLYTTDLNGGLLTIPTASNITAYTQPLTVEHRIEDMVLCSKADISGTLSFTRSLTHNFPADTSFVSSAMPFGDLFGRVYNLIEQSTWTSTWSDALIGVTIIPQFNSTLFPIAVTNAGAIKERWAMIFTNTTAFRIVGESVGEIGSGNTSSNAAPTNPATGVPYFTIPAAGWGAGWSTGNVLRFNTDACGTPFWAVRTVLQGPTSIDSDQFTLAFRGDVDRP